MSRFVPKLIIIIIVLSLLISCGGGNGGGDLSPGAPPYVYAELTSFPSNSAPNNFQSASVYVIDDSTGVSIDNAIVKINSTTLTYDQTKQLYQGNPIVMPGEDANLSVMVGQNTYSTIATTAVS